MRTVVVALVLALALAACTASDEGDDSTAAAPSCGVLPTRFPREKLDQVVTIYLTCRDDRNDPNDIKVVAVQRVVPVTQNVLLAALSQLFLGLTPEEADAGYVSVFSAFTAGQMLDATIVDGVAMLTVGHGFTDANNFSTTNMSAYVFRQLSTTVLQFAEITGFDFVLDGTRWCGFETDCEGQSAPAFTRATSSASVPISAESPARGARPRRQHRHSGRPRSSGRRNESKRNRRDSTPYLQRLRRGRAVQPDRIDVRAAMFDGLRDSSAGRPG